MVLVFSVRAVLPLFALLISAFSARAGEIPFDFVDGYILVHARVDAQPVTLVLDSGASASVLSLEAARRLHLPLGQPQSVDGVDAEATAFDMKRRRPPRRMGLPLGSFDLAIDLHNAAQLCSEHVDGLIGADFFKGRVTQIDYAHRCLRLLADGAGGRGVAAATGAERGFLPAGEREWLAAALDAPGHGLQ